MYRWMIIFVSMFLATGINIASGQSTQTAPSSDLKVAEGLKQLHHLASDVLKLDIGTIEKEGGEKNMVGFRSKDVLFSKRTDSRTYFIEDSRYQVDNGSGVIEDPDQQVIELSRKILSEFEIPTDEIATSKVLTQQLQTAQYDKTMKAFNPGKVQPGKRFVEITRAIHEIPVFTSRAFIGLSRARAIGSLEIHWPQIPEKIVADAQRLGQLVKTGFKAPQQKDATVESIEAGIIHSPAIGFVMDIYPVIRIIYANEKQIGKKLVLYLDANAKPVPIPRTFDRAYEKPLTEKRTVRKS